MVNKKFVDNWIVPIFVFVFIIVIVPIVTTFMEVHVAYENNISKFWDILRHQDTTSHIYIQSPSEDNFNV